MQWAAIKTFLYDKIMSNSGIFIGIFALIIGMFIWSNSSVILSKFGFETTTNLKAEVTRLQGELETAQRINKNLQSNLKDQETRHKAEIKAIVDSNKERELVKDKIIEIKTKKELKDKSIIDQFNKNFVITQTEITIPITEYNQLSTSNIESVQETFDTFFPELKDTKCSSNCF